MMQVEIPVKGGMLVLTDLNGQLAFDYRGFIPRDWAMELVRNTPDQQMTINGQPLLRWLAGLLDLTGGTDGQGRVQDGQGHADHRDA